MLVAFKPHECKRFLLPSPNAMWLSLWLGPCYLCTEQQMVPSFKGENELQLRPLQIFFFKVLQLLVILGSISLIHPE